MFLGILIPFIGTTLGAAAVFLMKNKMNNRLEKILLGFAAGVMGAASIWSLIIPSIEMTESAFSWVPTTVGFTLGILFLLVLEHIIFKLHFRVKEPGETQSKLKKILMMVLAVTLHNIPEGMAVGVCFAGAMSQNSGVTIAGAFALAVGIAIQNLPEGAIISMPLKSEGVSKPKSFLYGVLSGVVEPIAAVITLLITGAIQIVLPYLLSFAAGAMIYVIVKELIPESQKGEHSNSSVFGITVGFLIMMILDVTLG